MLKIGEFSKLSRVSVRMLRHYDQKGLLTPSEIDPMTGYRYYSENQLSQVFRITALKDLGFSLAAIREILTIYDDREALDAYLKVREAELTALWEDTTQKLRLLETARKRLRKDDNMKYNVTVKTLPERYAACVRMTLPRYEDEGMVWSVLCSETAPPAPGAGRPLLLQRDLPGRGVQGVRRGSGGTEDGEGGLSGHRARAVPHSPTGDRSQLRLPGGLFPHRRGQ